MFNRLLLLLWKWSLKQLHYYGRSPWENLSDIPEGVHYIVTGILPTESHSPNKPIWLTQDCDIMQTSVYFNEPPLRTVESHAIMLQLPECKIHNLQLGDRVRRRGNELVLTLGNAVDYSALAKAPVVVLTEEVRARFNDIFGEDPQPNSLVSRRMVCEKLGTLSGDWHHYGNSVIGGNLSAIEPREEALKQFREIHAMVLELGYPNIPETIQDFLDGKR